MLKSKTARVAIKNAIFNVSSRGAKRRDDPLSPAKRGDLNLLFEMRLPRSFRARNDNVKSFIAFTLVQFGSLLSSQPYYQLQRLPQNKQRIF